MTPHIVPSSLAILIYFCFLVFRLKTFDVLYVLAKKLDLLFFILLRNGFLREKFLANVCMTHVPIANVLNKFHEKKNFIFWLKKVFVRQEVGGGN